jgi:hypothetical protein
LCEDMACCSSECIFKFLYAGDNIHYEIDQFVSNIPIQPQTEPHTDSHASYSGAVWRERRTILGAKFKLLYSEIALSWKPFGIGHMQIHTFLLRMTDTMTSQNIDISSWDTLYKPSCWWKSCRTYWDHIPQQYKPFVRVRTMCLGAPELIQTTRTNCLLQLELCTQVSTNRCSRTLVADI